MADERRNLVKKTHRRGFFGKYTVSGFQYESETGDVSWHITSYPGHDPIHDFWVTRGTFFAVKIHYAYNHSMDTLIETFGAVENVDPEEKQAISEAIKLWEAELQEQPRE